MKCTKCGNELQENQKFCTVCGTKTETEKRCPQCNGKLEENQKFCNVCGFKIENIPGQEKQEHQVVILPQTQSRNHGKKLLIGGGIICLFILLVGVFIFRIYNEDSEVIISRIEMHENIWGHATVTFTFDNYSDSAIKNLDFAFMAWDEKQLPVVVSEEFDYDSNIYCLEVNCNKICIKPNASETVSIDVVSEMEKLHYIQPFVVEYTFYDGSGWENMKANSLANLAGNKLKNLEGVYVMEEYN